MTNVMQLMYITLKERRFFDKKSALICHALKEKLELE